MGVRKNITIGGKEQPPRIERWEIIKRIQEVKRLRDQALLSFIYLTGCRIQEVVYYRKEKNPHRQVVKKIEQEDGSIKRIKVHEPIEQTQVLGEPIKKRQLEIKNNLILIHDVRCLKRKQKKYRTIPIVIRDQEIDFINIIQKYIKTLEPEEPLFSINRRRAFAIAENAGFYLHYLRHLRATHLAVHDGFNTEELKKFFGWTDANTATNYVHLDVRDLANKMRGV